MVNDMTALPQDRRAVDDGIDREMGLSAFDPSGCVVGGTHSNGNHQDGVDSGLSGFALAVVQHLRHVSETIADSSLTTNCPWSPHLCPPRADACSWSEGVQVLSHALGNRPKSARESHLANCGRDYEDADVVASRVSRHDEEAMTVWTVVQGAADNHLAIEQRYFDSAAMLWLAGAGAFDVARIPGKVAHEEDPLQTSQRNDDAIVCLGSWG